MFGVGFVVELVVVPKPLYFTCLFRLLRLLILRPNMLPAAMFLYLVNTHVHH